MKARVNAGHVKAGSVASLVVLIACLGMAGFASEAGCNGTGTTPVCTFPDGANDPEAGCGVLIEASAPVDGASPVDATSPHVSDAAPE